jgi:hypothetical protein
MTAKRWIIPGAGILAVALFGILYATDRPVYFGLLKMLMLTPFPHPFIDWEWLPSAVACWAQGIDVYVNNTCYTVIHGGRFNYSPLWLRATFLPAGAEWVAPFGVAIAFGFFLALAALPLPKGRRAWIMTGLATFSSTTAFGVERGNADLILFVMIVLAVMLWNYHIACRWVGYLLFGLAGLLKFYPLVLFIMALRERVMVFLSICLTVMLTLLIFAWAYGAETLRALSALPKRLYFTDMFGAVNLPFGLVRAVLFILNPADDWSESALARGRVASVVLIAALILGMGVGATWLVRRGGLRAGLAALSQQERGFLVAGAAVVVGCFFAGQSIGYRGVYLLLVLPGLLSMAQALPEQLARATMALTCWSIVFVMWVITIQVALFLAGLNPIVPSSGSLAGMAHWLVNQLAWWLITTVLVSVLLAFVMDSAVWSALVPRLAAVGGTEQAKET